MEDLDTFCVFVSEELALAVDAVQVGLCAGADAGREAVEPWLREHPRKKTTAQPPSENGCFPGCEVSSP